MRYRFELVIAATIVLSILMAGLLAGLVVFSVLFKSFVVPTNAMAPTIWGRQRDLVCPKCGHSYRVSASDEIDFFGGSWRTSDSRVVGGTCPNCRYTLNVVADVPVGEESSSRRGDRIWVHMLQYEWAEPERWDVAVFQYPADPNVNFVMRVAGLPNETVRIADGDIYVHRARPEFAIARKPPKVARRMLQIVHDGDHRPSGEGWPLRWSPMPAAQEPDAGRSDGWAASAGAADFSIHGTDDEVHWLGYQHLIPSYEDWQSVSAGESPADLTVKPQLITDFFAGNTELVVSGFNGRRASETRPPDPCDMGLHWVGDLAVECHLQVRGRKGEVVLAVVEAGRLMSCHLDLSTGEARLSLSDNEDFHPAGTTRIREPGDYTVLFANVDDQLLLWVDDELIAFCDSTMFESSPDAVPTMEDLRPVRIGARGAAVTVSHLKVFRDIYYIAVRMRPGEFQGAMLSDFDAADSLFGSPKGKNVADALALPEQWSGMISGRRSVDFELSNDQFLVLGDNSARSKDSRLWELDDAPFYVRRDQLLGKVRQ